MIRFFRSLIVAVLIPLSFPISLAEGQLRTEDERRVDAPFFIRAHVTAYTLSEQPTASGERVREGFVASNMLPLNTIIRIEIPEKVYGRYFVVKDRMNDDYSTYPDNRHGIDIWTNDRSWAKQFGRNRNVLVWVVKLGDNRRSM